jgi:hypothetical protein
MQVILRKKLKESINIIKVMALAVLAEEELGEYKKFLIIFQEEEVIINYK